MNKRLRALFLALPAVSLFLGSGVAGAATITVTYSGTVTTSTVASISVGETFTGVYSYDDTVPDSSPADPVNGHYNGISFYQLTFSGGASYTATLLPDEVYIVNDNLAGEDVYFIDVGDGVNTWTLHLHDDEGTVFGSDALSVPDLSHFSDASDFTTLALATGAGSAGGNVTALNAVPEPASSALLGLGLAAFGSRRYQQRPPQARRGSD